MKRRDLFRHLSAVPLIGGLFGFAPSIHPLLAPAKPVRRDFIKELGLRRFINAAGTYTSHTASLMPEEVMEAVNFSAREYVMLDDVQDKVGERIAAMCHAEAATVTAGCWSAMVLGTAGVLTGTDPKLIVQLPNVDSLPRNKMIVQKAHNVGYVHAPSNTGIHVVEVETREDLEKAIDDKTAMMWFLNYEAPMGRIQHEEWVEVARAHSIPTMIDMAADVPPVENLWRFNDMGFDLVCISGGKGLRGPQSAGILMGRKELIAAARMHAPPRGNNIGRGMKVNKEEIFAMYAAVERYINMDHQKEWKTWEDQIGVIEQAAKSVAGVKTEITVPPIANHTPLLLISWEQDRIKMTTRQMRDRLRNGNPSIEVMGNDETINITVFMLKPGEEKIVAKRVREELAYAG